MTVGYLKEMLDTFDDTDDIGVTLSEIDEFTDDIKIYKDALGRVMIDGQWECSQYSLALLAETVLDRDVDIMEPRTADALDEFIERSK